MKVTAVVLAAGASSRFGSPKLLASLADRPVLQHVLDAVAATGLDDTVVVLGDGHSAVEGAIAWRDERRVVNPRPGDGLSSSLRVGLDAAADDPATEAVIVLLGDQPAIRPEVIRAVVEAAGGARRPSCEPATPPTAPRTPSSSDGLDGLTRPASPATAASGPSSPRTRTSSSPSTSPAPTPTSTPRPTSPPWRRRHPLPRRSPDDAHDPRRRARDVLG